MKKQIVTILFLSLIFSACNLENDRKGKENNPEETGNTAEIVPAANPNPEGVFVLKGELKEREILLKISIKDFKVEGGYYFTDEGKERKIAGSVVNVTGGDVIEYDENNKPVGIIKGMGNLQGVAELVYAQPDGSNPTPFTLQKVDDANMYQPK